MTKKTKAVAAKEPAHDDRKRAAQLALMPSINTAVLMAAYEQNIVGKDMDMPELVDGLRASFDTAKGGDLSKLEAMLIGQATALQAIFVSLGRRAQVQEYQKNFQAFLGLALKAQAQSRATIQAVVELKYPRQVAFVKQANISNGPQQVNNGPYSETSTRTGAHAEENQPQQNELLEDRSHERTHLDTGTAQAAGGSNPALEAVATVNRAEKRGR